jgi:hypothetical protein
MRNSKGDTGLAREERLQIMLSPEELKAVDNFRFQHRMPTRAAAVRELLRHGIEEVGISPVAENAGITSGDYSVLKAQKEWIETQLISRGCMTAKTSARPCVIMTDKTIDLDDHRGMAAQKATELRRLLADVEANEKDIAPSPGWTESAVAGGARGRLDEPAEKARYLLNLFAATLAAHDPRRQKLIAAVLADFARLSDESGLFASTDD